MHVHEEVLRAALRICRERGDWTFTPQEIVRALPNLNSSSVRTHIVSRCCVNAPKHHAHRWDYFHRVARGRYEIRPAHRKGSPDHPQRTPRTVTKTSSPVRDTIHAVLTRSNDWYVVECLEVPVVTQGRTIDESLANLREALDLHLDGENLDALGLGEHPRLNLTFETALSMNA